MLNVGSICTLSFILRQLLECKHECIHLLLNAQKRSNQTVYTCLGQSRKQEAGHCQKIYCADYQHQSWNCAGKLANSAEYWVNEEEDAMEQFLADILTDSLPNKRNNWILLKEFWHAE